LPITAGGRSDILAGVLNGMRLDRIVAIAICAAASTDSGAAVLGYAAQDRDADTARTMDAASRDVVRTAATQADRFETDHVILYIDKGLLAPDAARAFAGTMERCFVAASDYVGRRFDPAVRRVAKPSLYLTDRAGISHAEVTRLFLRAARVIPSPAIAIHEAIHLLLMRNPDAPRNRSDLPPDEDKRLTATTGVWLAEGFAGYAAYEVAPTLGLDPDRLFVKGDRSTVDAEARTWMRDARGGTVLPFVGSHGIPEGLLADRVNVAPPFYVLGHSFTKYLVGRVGLERVVRLYEEHFDGTRSIEEDVKRITGMDLARLREQWLDAIAR
jgi:hypothetical protein